MVLNGGIWEKWAPKVDVVWHAYITAEQNFWKITVASGSPSSLLSTMIYMNGFDTYFLIINSASNGTYVAPFKYFLQLKLSENDDQIRVFMSKIRWHIFIFQKMIDKFIDVWTVWNGPCSGFI